MIKGWTWKKDGTLGSFCDRIEGDKLYRGDIYFSIAGLKRDGYEIVPMMAVEIPEPVGKFCNNQCPFKKFHLDIPDGCSLNLSNGQGGPGADCPAGRKA